MHKAMQSVEIEVV